MTATATHVTDDELEQLAFLQAERKDIARLGGAFALSQDHMARVEEHILACPECAQRASDEAEFVNAIHNAALMMRCAE